MRARTRAMREGEKASVEMSSGGFWQSGSKEAVHWFLLGNVFSQSLSTCKRGLVSGRSLYYTGREAGLAGPSPTPLLPRIGESESSFLGRIHLREMRRGWIVSVPYWEQEKLPHVPVQTQIVLFLSSSPRSYCSGRGGRSSMRYSWWERHLLDRNVRATSINSTDVLPFTESPKSERQEMDDQIQHLCLLAAVAQMEKLTYFLSLVNWQAAGISNSQLMSSTFRTAATDSANRLLSTPTPTLVVSRVNFSLPESFLPTSLLCRIQLFDVYDESVLKRIQPIPKRYSLKSSSSGGGGSVGNLTVGLNKSQKSTISGDDNNNYSSGGRKFGGNGWTEQPCNPKYSRHLPW